MEKIYGAAERKDGIRQTGRRRWEVYYGYGEDAGGKYRWRHTFEYRPAFEEVRAMVLAQANANVQAAITGGFRWNDMAVWLSQENQLNYARDFDLVAKSDQESDQVALPTYKFGTDETPIYYTFTSVDELRGFNRAWSAHITEAIAAGWREKSAIDWEAYRL